MLTLKQEKFVQNLIDGMSQREAYKLAYPKSLKWKESAIDTQASILFKNSKVLERFNLLRDKAASKAIWTREQAINDLVAIKNKCVEVMTYTKVDETTGEEIEIIDTKTATTAINAIKELNNMNGYNESNMNMEINKVVITDDI